MSQDEIIRREAFERMNSVGSTSGSDIMSPGFNQMDVNMDMDTDESSETSNATANMGAVGWM